MGREALDGYKEIFMQQVLQADKQAFFAMSDLCRSGLGRDPAGTRYAERALNIVRADPMVMTRLNHLPRSSSSRPDPVPKSKGKGGKQNSPRVRKDVPVKAAKAKVTHTNMPA